MKVSRGTWKQRGGSVRLTGNMTGHDGGAAQPGAAADGAQTRAAAER
jgi:hypothetical protein